ncbi:hypothetical protein, partial [Herbiconiux daphne]
GTFWSSIEAVHSSPFVGEVTAGVLDTMQTLNYGDRVLFSKMEGFNSDDVAPQIVAIYKDKWLALIAAAIDGFNLGATESRKGSETISSSEKKDISREDINRVSAYNSNELIEDAGTSVNEVDNTTGDTVRKSTDDTLNLDALYNNLTLADKTAIIKVALKDVSNYLTLSIYE